MVNGNSNAFIESHIYQAQVNLVIHAFAFHVFAYPRFYFSKYEEHQYPIRGQMLKRRTFSRFIKERDAHGKLSIKEL
jgi:hypothetical protein